jgi:tetratricopeptide (TPR) repeat protein
VQRSAHRLRVHVQSRNVHDGSTLASARHESDAVDLFGLQDAVANTVMNALGGEATAAGAQKAGLPQNPAAYELYLRAGDRLSRGNRWDVRTAIEMLESATTLAPRFADAWARLAEARTVMGVVFEPGGNWLPVAQTAVRRALALDRHNAHALSARGRLLWTPAHGFKNRLALRTLATALRLNPSCHDALVWQGLIFYHVGMTEDARASLTGALTANPLDGFAHSFLAQTVLFSGDYEGGEEITQRVLAADPANLYSNLFAPMNAIYRNDLAAMTDRVQRAVHIVGPDPLLDSYQALAQAREGDRRKAQRMAAAVLKQRSRLHSHHAVHMVAAVYAVVGDKAKATALLKKAANTGFPHYSLFRNDRHFESLHTYKSFQRLMTSVKREGMGYQREFGTAR